MEVNTAEIQNDDIQSPSQQRSPQEAKDAADNQAVQMISTPVARKTRGAILKKFSEYKSENIDEVSTAVPKTPRASTNNRMLSETPRRSTRKSIRPPKDYDDIIEHHSMSVNSKAASAKRNISTAVDEAHSEEMEDETDLKWNVAEIGRSSCKRNRKSNRKTTKKTKVDTEISKLDMEEDDKQEYKMKEMGTISGEPQSIKVEYEEQENLGEMEIATAPPQNMEEECDKQETIAAIETATTALQHIIKEEKNTSIAAEAQFSDKEESSAPAENDKEIETIIKTDDLDLKNKAKPMLICEEAEDTLAISKKVGAEEMDELGLAPLGAKDHSDEEPFDEMPSLLLRDDEDEPNETLNITFDADDSVLDKNLLLLNAVEAVEPEKTVSKQPQVAIKVVLTDLKDQEITLLNPNDISLPTAKSAGFRFPTPMKNASKTNFKFVGSSISTITENNIELESSCGSRRRSRSMSGLSKSKVVSFYSPIEIAAVQDIDKRWEGLNKSNVTQRRKRSISLDDRKFVSRIPKPKLVPAVKPITPTQQKGRTKVPNFAAIHQKQFNQMENLVEHMERKAQRAKVLSNSAVKQAPSCASVQKSSAKKLVTSTSSITLGERSHSRALKKIDLPNFAITPMQPDQLQRHKQLPTPRKIVAVLPVKSATAIDIRKPLVSNAARAAFNLSSLVAKKPPEEESIREKLQARRQRHMDMFKGRVGKEPKGEFIRGVRSNRRFELQMQHRRQMDENNS